MPSRRVAIQSLLGAAASGASGMAQRGKRALQPNFVILLADDLGYGDVGCFGSPDVRTPNIDSIARNGIRFTDGYVSACVCSPSRAALMTGRYQHRSGHEFNFSIATNKTIGGPAGLLLNEITLPQLLKGGGYSTGMVGKWHLGFLPELQPTARGFDEYFGFLSGANHFLTSKTPTGEMVDTEDSRTGILPERRETLYRGTKPVVENEYLTDVFGRESVEFIERHKSEPFFLYTAFNAVHTPLQAIAKYIDRYAGVKDPRHRMLAAMTSALDDAIGSILQRIRDCGLERDTLVVFLSDNGCPTYTKAGTNGPLNGSKCTVYEGGIRVPFAAQWPGHLPAGHVYRKPVVSRDLLPTFLAAAGIPLPHDREYDGVNLMPYLTGQNNSTPHDTLFWRHSRNSAVRSGNWKLVRLGEEKTHLYDLSKDLGEKQDVSGDKPKVVKRLIAAYNGWSAKMMAPRWAPWGIDIPINGEAIHWEV